VRFFRSKLSFIYFNNIVESTNFLALAALLQFKIFYGQAIVAVVDEGDQPRVFGAKLRIAGADFLSAWPQTFITLAKK